ncbi:hypothetical protein [Methylobacterium sp. E-046]|uniref:hypothetical protein n=1 Tax=Methylobacterium sp. E-046 TaxID=2836576 RepID=UPI001FB88708|nr:hypothetical protein [Methylobacterium sp. E-046]MCJ2101989.1 hypothetical protein [Methylobacterium sp. E-046]
MDAGLTLAKLIGPIAAATIVTVFWFALMWRGHRTEKARGKPTWQYEVGLFGYIAAVTLFAYLRLGSASTSGLDLFGTALAAEGLGIGVAYTLLHAFVQSRGRPWSERAFPVVASLFLVGVVFATVLTT